MNKEKLLTGARTIADRLLADAIEANGGITWETMTMGEGRKIDFAQGEGIYSGSAGIILFLMELHRITGEQKYKDAVAKGAVWLLDFAKSNPTDYYAFYTGRVGVAYTLVKLAGFLGEDKYRTEGLELVRGVEAALESERLIEDLINGVSGAMVGLIHLYDMTGEEWLLEKIEKLSGHLINRTSIGARGLYWDRSNQSIRGLCGFSHGASGIAWAFLELARYFDQPAYNWITYQGFAYENSHYRPEQNNWPDFRKGIYDDDSYVQHKDAFLKGDYEFFKDAGDMSAWCHGAPGIALSRIRAYEVLGDNSLREDALNAMEKTKKVTLKWEGDVPGSFTVCHGRGGNAMSLLEATRHWKEDDFTREVEPIGEAIIKELEAGNSFVSGFAFAKDLEDRSLYMGNAGIGYFLLQAYDPYNVPSIVMPVLDGKVKDRDAAFKAAPGLAAKEWQLKEQVLSKDFARTIILLKKALDDNSRKAAYDFHTSDIVKGFDQKVKEVFAKVDDKHREQIEDVYALEKAKVDMDRKIESCALLQIKNMLHHEYVEENLKDNPENLEGLQLILDSDTQVVTTKYDWSAEDEQIDFHTEEPDGENYVLLKAQAMGISEFPLNDFSYVVIENFKQEGTMEDAFIRTKDQFDLESPEEEAQLRALVGNQVKEAVFSGILLIKQTQLATVEG